MDSKRKRDDSNICNKSCGKPKYKRERIFAFFMDLKAAFDRVDRNKTRKKIQRNRDKRKTEEKNNGDVRETIRTR